MKQPSEADTGKSGRDSVVRSGLRVSTQGRCILGHDVYDGSAGG